MENERLEFLLHRYFDLALSGGEKQELEYELLESATAREAFWELSRWHGAIRQWGEEELGRHDVPEVVGRTPPAPPPLRILPSPKRVPPSAHGRWKQVKRPWYSTPIRLLAAAAAIVLGFFAWAQWSSVNSGKSLPIAQLIHTSDVIWSEEDSSHQEGGLLRSGTLKLKSGVLQINFSRGAHVVLEGPAEFEPLTDNSGLLHFGKLMATVPESAHGFTVQTPDFSVVDHGTKFGCMVPVTAAPEVHVFQGAVGVKTSTRTERELHVNQAVRITGAQIEDIPANAESFFTEEKLLARLNLEKWRQFSSSFSQHDGMLVHFDFEKESIGAPMSTLINRVPNSKPLTHGLIEGCQWTEGRWPAKGALKFNSIDDRVRLSLPGEYSAMTFVAFIRVDSITNRENSLIQATPQDQLGEANWYISNDGALGLRSRVAPRGSASQWLRVFSEPVIRDEALGSWHMVATVYNGTTVTHYLDGKVTGSTPVQLPGPISLRDLQIGNGISILKPRTPNEINVNFVGSIDQLAVLSVPLTSREMAEIYARSSSVTEEK